MFVAIDTVQGLAVTGIDVDTRAEDVAAQRATDRLDRTSKSRATRFRCVCCNAPLQYTGLSAHSPIECFTHDRSGCIRDGNMSIEHRLGQEMIAKALFNLLPTDRTATRIDLERRIGTNSDFVIADVRVTKPIQLAVEVVYLSPALNLRQRLRTLFAQGYAGMIIILPTGELSTSRIEQHLGKVGTIDVGRFDPRTLELEFGSVLIPDRIDLETQVWNSIPAYLS